jgi:phage gp45-like
MTGPSIADLQRITDPIIRSLVGAIRRMAIRVTSRPLWQVTGYEIDGTTETQQAEPFTGIGFFARPPASGKPEAIVVAAAGAKSPAIVAVRDEKTRAAVAGTLAEDEAMVYGSTALVHVTAGGTVEARAPGGTAVYLATKADIDALRAWLANLTLPVTTNGTATSQAGWAGPPPPGGLPPSPPIPAISGAPPTAAGTTVLKGQ